MSKTVADFLVNPPGAPRRDGCLHGLAKFNGELGVRIATSGLPGDDDDH
jgi:hypothetical protein